MKDEIQNIVSYGGEKEQWSVIGNVLHEGARAWNISKNRLLLIWLIPIVIALGGVVTALLGKEAYKWYTGEDRFAENIQVLLYLGAFVFAFIVFRQLLKMGERVLSVLYLVALLGLFFLIGEELSWGQRIFNWETPESFQEINKQGETTLHNIPEVEAAFKWIQMLVGTYGTVLPLLLIGVGFFRRNQKFFSYIIPHYSLMPFFLPMFAWRFYRNIFEVPAKYYFVVSEFNEVIEFILAAGTFLFMFYQFRNLRKLRN